MRTKGRKDRHDEANSYFLVLLTRLITIHFFFGTSPGGYGGNCRKFRKQSVSKHQGFLI